MKKILIIGLFLSMVSCKYKEDKATFSIVEVDTIAVDRNVLRPIPDTLTVETVNVSQSEIE